mmetsp:Transcript_30302/g.47019  ORF Transcript_30302/g.47019 Transcript_30302/m.47019 type:complete len:200 (-) Transcript_30302:1263-1862(-)
MLRNTKLLDLVTSNQRDEVVFGEKGVGCSMTEQPPHRSSSFVRAEEEGFEIFRGHIRVFFRTNWVGPKERGDRTLERGFLEPINFLDITKLHNIWTDSTMNTEKVTKIRMNHSGERHRIKHLHTQIIHFLPIFHNTFSMKVEILSDLPTLVVTPQHPKHLWEVDFEGKKIQNRFKTKHPTIHIISQEEALCVRWCPRQI